MQVGQHRVLARVATRHPDLAAQRLHRHAGELALFQLVLADVVGEAVVVALVGVRIDDDVGVRTDVDSEGRPAPTRGPLTHGLITAMAVVDPADLSRVAILRPGWTASFAACEPVAPRLRGEVEVLRRERQTEEPGRTVVAFDRILGSDQLRGSIRRPEERLLGRHAVLIRLPNPASVQPGGLEGGDRPSACSESSGRRGRSRRCRSGARPRHPAPVG